MTKTFSRLLKPSCLTVSLILVSIATHIPAQASNFKGYYTPTVLISPLRDDLMYTPVGGGRITSKAGYRVHPVTGRHSFHSGVDLAAKLNDRVYALLDGVVTRVGYRGNLGVAVEIYHPYPNVRTINGHLNAYSVLPGMWVQRGRVIGYAGTTGRSTGVHLHYTVIREDTKEYIEPLEFLRQIPSYLSALKTARVQAAMKYNLDRMKKIEEEPIDTEDEDLPDNDKKADPPDA
ncbi:MAG: M23 family metallopeptidase [Candidatus Obscuribacterales bacterium]|nr:M23 family metallopeptidase [Candidatus Obscuribacterales bacterium]